MAKRLLCFLPLKGRGVEASVGIEFAHIHTRACLPERMATAG